MARSGPQTDSGKEAVKLNALRHGIYSESPVIPGIESEDAWNAHLDGVLHSYAPDGHLETELAERIAQLLWRLRRVGRFERQAIELGRERVAEDNALQRSRMIHGRMLNQPKDPLDDPDELARRVADASAILAEVQKLPSLRSDHQIRGEVIEFLYDIEENEVDSDVYEALELDDVPDDWTAEAMRERLERTETQLGEPNVILNQLLARAEAKLEPLQDRERRLSVELDRLTRERLLPDESALTKVTRYESHLHRQLIQTMHELEAIQSRRRGLETPLARLDVTVSAGELATD